MDQKYLVSQSVGASKLIKTKTRDEFLQSAGLSTVVPDRFTLMTSGQPEGTIIFNVKSSTGFISVVDPEGVSRLLGSGDATKYIKYEWCIPTLGNYTGNTIKNFFVCSTLEAGQPYGTILDWNEASTTSQIVLNAPIRLVVANMSFDKMRNDTTGVSIRTTTGYVKSVWRDGCSDSRWVVAGGGIPSTDITTAISVLAVVDITHSPTAYVYFPKSSIESDDNNITFYPCDSNGTVTGEITAFGGTTMGIASVSGTSSTIVANPYGRLYAHNCRLLKSLSVRYSGNYGTPYSISGYVTFFMYYSNLPALISSESSPGNTISSSIVSLPSRNTDYSVSPYIQNLVISNYDCTEEGTPYYPPKLHPAHTDYLINFALFRGDYDRNFYPSSTKTFIGSDNDTSTIKKWNMPNGFTFSNVNALLSAGFSNVVAPFINISARWPRTDPTKYVETYFANLIVPKITLAIPLHYTYAVKFNYNCIVDELDISGSYQVAPSTQFVLLGNTYDTYGSGSSWGGNRLKRIIISTLLQNHFVARVPFLSPTGSFMLGHNIDVANYLTSLTQIWLQGWGNVFYAQGMILPSRVGKPAGTIYCAGSPAFYNMASVITECQTKNWILNTDNVNVADVPLA